LIISRKRVGYSSGIEANQIVDLVGGPCAQLGPGLFANSEETRVRLLERRLSWRPQIIMTSPAHNLEKKNLILVPHPGRQDWHDFEAIAHEIARMAPDIFGYIVSIDKVAQSIPRRDWRRRSLIVSFADLGRVAFPRGRVFQNAWIPKYDEYLLFTAAKVRVPFTTIFRNGKQFDCSKHGSLVVAKPTKIGSMSHGNHVFLMRRERVESIVPTLFSSQLVSDEAPIIVQDFIDTGATPEHFRVLVLFGEPLLCFKSRSTVQRPRLDATDAQLESGRVATNSDERAIEFVSDVEVIDFARKASQAIWWIPLQGLDIIREATTGALYVLESNPGGNTWAFSSQLGERLRKLVGGAEPLKNQFGAWTIAAKALIRATRSYAA